MSGPIFISYRRDDSSASAGRLYDGLKRHFASNQIFMDVDSLDLGVDFIEAIEEGVGSCDVLIAVIGKSWLISSDEEGRRRLDNPEDFVRIEIATALKRNIRVIPVLVDGASMPRSGDLPDDLKSLIRRNALEVSHNRFRTDSERLLVAVERALEKTSEIERCETEAKKRFVIKHRQKEEQEPSTSPGKRKLGPVPVIVTLLALLIGLVVAIAIYNNKPLVPAQSPGVVYQSSHDQLHCFVIGNNGHLYGNFRNGQQWVWEDQGPPPGAAAVSSSSAVYQTLHDRLHCFVVGNNGHLYDRFQNGQQWVWEDRGTASGTTAISSANAVYQTSLDRLHCFVVGKNGYLYDNYWNGQQWIWEEQGLPPRATAVDSPAAVYQASADRLHCFVIGNGHLFDNFWNGQQWVWEDVSLGSIRK
jgi:hypothetical protein